jgi:hypothetical protein
MAYTPRSSLLRSVQKQEKPTKLSLRLTGLTTDIYHQTQTPDMWYTQSIKPVYYKIDNLVK